MDLTWELFFCLTEGILPMELVLVIRAVVSYNRVTIGTGEGAEWDKWAAQMNICC